MMFDNLSTREKLYLGLLLLVTIGFLIQAYYLQIEVKEKTSFYKQEYEKCMGNIYSDPFGRQIDSGINATLLIP